MENQIEIYLLGGPHHGTIEYIDSCTSLSKEVTGKTHTGILTMMCYYESTGTFDSDGRLIFQYNDDKAHFVRFRTAELIDDFDRLLLKDIRDSFASCRIPLLVKVDTLNRVNPDLLRSIRNGIVDDCHIPVYSKKSGDMTLYITAEDAKKIRDAI